MIDQVPLCNHKHKEKQNEMYYVYTMEPGQSSQLIFIGSKHELTIEENNTYLFNQDDVLSVKTELNTDNKPLIEFSTARSLYHKGQGSIEFPFNNEEIHKKMSALK